MSNKVNVLKVWTHTTVSKYVFYKEVLQNYVFEKMMFLKEVSHAHQGGIYLVKNTVKIQ